MSMSWGRKAADAVYELSLYWRSFSALSVHLAACLDVALHTEGYFDCGQLWKHHSLTAGLRALNKDTSSDIWAPEGGLKSKALWETIGSWYFYLFLHWSLPHLGEYYFTWTNCSLNSLYCFPYKHPPLIARIIRLTNLRVGKLLEIRNGAIFGLMITYMRLVKMGQKTQAFLTQMVQFWWGNCVSLKQNATN